MIEELEGKHLLAFADTVDGADCAQIAAEVRNFATSCAYGVASTFDAAAGRKLATAQDSTRARYPAAVRRFGRFNHLFATVRRRRLASAQDADAVADLPPVPA